MQLTRAEREALSPGDDPELIADVAESLALVRSDYDRMRDKADTRYAGQRLEVVQARRAIRMVLGTVPAGR